LIHFYKRYFFENMAAWQQFSMATAPEPQQMDSDDDDPTVYRGHQGQLSFHGNERTMNINPLILTNIQGSPYFKVELFGKKTFHEVVDEIYYKVDHLEPWATGSRKTAGRSQTGMCGGVRGVSAGGIVSSAYCLLFKLYTLKMTKKQVMGLLNHCDSPYIRGLGFMYLRYTLPPANMWDWFEPYLEDEEEIDIKAGGGKPMTIGEMCKTMLTRLEWFDTRFPRIAVTFEKVIRDQLDARAKEMAKYKGNRPDYQQQQQQQQIVVEENTKTERKESENMSRSKSRDRDRKSKDRKSRDRSRSRSRDRKKKDRSRSREKKDRSRDKSREKKDRSRDRSRSRAKKDRSRDRSRSRDKKRRDRSRSRDRSRDRHHKKHNKRSRSKSRDKKRSRDRDNRDKYSRDRDDYSRELQKYKESRKHRRSRSRS